jgi:hypothetical protein
MKNDTKKIVATSVDLFDEILKKALVADLEAFKAKKNSAPQVFTGTAA